MGACQSCLGIGRKNSCSSESDASGLLGGEHHQFHYGTFDDDAQPDPDAIRRERDALEQLCLNTNGQMVDVTEIPNLRPSDRNLPDMAAIVGPEVAALLSDTIGNPTLIHPSDVPDTCDVGGQVMNVVSTKHLSAKGSVAHIQGHLVKVF